MKHLLGLALLLHVPGVQKDVEILRDRWGVPHIYASTVHDLFFAQGYITAKDRLFQIDLWRRVGSGKLSEVLGPSAIERDKLARSVNFHGDWNREWAAYGPDSKAIVTAFTDGINAYIRDLKGTRPKEFQLAGYDPGEWAPEDCLSRVAGMLMTGNMAREVRHAQDISSKGLDWFVKYYPPDPYVKVEVPHGLDLSDITSRVIHTYTETIGAVHLPGEQGSNNWVVDGSMTTTGRPILANDPHRPVQLPSLRKTVHLVGPGWNAFGAGEPALPAIALGHNENIAFGFTIVGIDQQDLYVEKTNPQNPGEYQYRGAWKKFEVTRQTLKVKGTGEQSLELLYTIHGPVIYQDPSRNRAYTLKWVGSEPGTAGYLAGLTVARANDWNSFRTAMDRYRVPSENVIYADTKGNIGWQVAGLTPIRENWNGLLPVPGDTGEYEWSGFRKSTDLPWEYNPARHFVATANNNVLPPNFPFPVGYDGWAPPFRVERIREMLTTAKKFDIADFERMQQDVTSLPARRFQAALRQWTPKPDTREARTIASLLQWDAVLRADSREALIYEVWVSKLAGAVLGPELGIAPESVSRADVALLMRTIEARFPAAAAETTLRETLAQLDRQFGSDESRWQWGNLHKIVFRHPIASAGLNLGPVSRPGDSNTVNATSGINFQQSSGASFREIIDVGNWDRSVMTNVPGESGDPASRHYGDLLDDWAAGRYHPMPFSRKAVEAATEERIVLKP